MLPLGSILGHLCQSQVVMLEAVQDQKFSEMCSPYIKLLPLLVAGRGKRTVLKFVEAFEDFWLSNELMRKSAPTKTASRVNGGDTCHAQNICMWLSEIS